MIAYFHIPLQLHTCLKQQPLQSVEVSDVRRCSRWIPRCSSSIKPCFHLIGRNYTGPDSDKLLSPFLVEMRYDEHRWDGNLLNRPICLWACFLAITSAAFTSILSSISYYPVSHLSTHQTFCFDRLPLDVPTTCYRKLSGQSTQLRHTHPFGLYDLPAIFYHNSIPARKHTVFYLPRVEAHINQATSRIAPASRPTPNDKPGQNIEYSCVAQGLWLEWRQTPNLKITSNRRRSSSLPTAEPQEEEEEKQ